MVYKIVSARYGIFVESLVLATIIFIIGFSIGYYIESYRASSISLDYKSQEVQALDIRLQSDNIKTLNKSMCDAAVEQNFILADKIYDTGLTLQKYEEASQITDDLVIEKKKYVLLKTELWMNSIRLKEKCDTPFDTVVYFYSGTASDAPTVSEQQIISNILKSIKEKKGNKIILLPIAGDLDLDSVSFQMKVYNVTSLPSILINEKTVLNGFHSEEEVESHLQY
ncbi:hypothetical protein KW787_01130 [Candidatus Pacearchaeota archaeon]|nr:hypothetical protein [Candidatus Pacearchaeota archaeon]